ncbi:MAG: thioesterase family protein [Mycobacteriaceae bacterium]|nr:thioesterase family protein [Mycobacteriaceae bacterium]
MAESTPISDAAFSDAMAVRPLGDGAYAGELNKHWTIGPKVHGGAMLALCAAAARAAHGGSVEPISVSANYLSAPNPGEMRLETFVRKRGRRVSVVDVELIGGERVRDERSRKEQESRDERSREEQKSAVHAVVTLGEPEHLVPPLLSANPLASVMSPEPPPDVEPIGPGHPMYGTVNYWRGVDVRPLMSTVPDGPSPDGRAPVIQIWARPRGTPPDILFALMCGDVSPPVAFAVGRRGWAPTVQLTAYLRGLPADGWLRVMATTTQIGQDWFDEDHLVVDCEGRIIVQTRQLALVPDH